MFEQSLPEETAKPAPDEAQSVLVREVDTIAVYRKADGDIVIRQRHPMRGADPYIVVPPEQAEKLIDAIRRGLNPK
jgi:hypothetical protein